MNISKIYLANPSFGIKIGPKLEDEINWNWMVYHEADEEHNNEAWFTMPDEDSWKYDEAKVALEILEKFDNATLK